MGNVFELDSFLAKFASLAESRGFQSEVLCETENGPLVAWEKVGAGPVVYISAGMHGDEPAGPLAVLDLMKRGFFDDGKHWMICPALNPEGLSANTRENGSGIDLNRDYLLQESPEVTAHVAWLKGKALPDVFVSLHEDWETEGFYFYEINLGEDQPLRAESLLSAVSKYFPPEPGPDIDGHEAREPGWIYHGADADLPDLWPEAIYLAKLGCSLSFTFETPSAEDLEKRVAAHVEGLMNLLGQP
ncbi:MAG: M14 family metallocarboxypeptidase [Akkermansiaceae bacterium]